ncbi:MAG: AarF/UbiB family protein [Acidimicrobiales bacterium]
MSLTDQRADQLWAGQPLTWQQAVPEQRRAQAKRIPSLTHPPRVPPLGRAATVLRHVGTALVAWRWKEHGTDQSVAGLSRRIRLAAEQLGPTYIKLLQIISAGDGLFPAELVAECIKCRDQVPPAPYASVVASIESELGLPMHKIFSQFDPEPIAAASIAQVHAAVLKSGEHVVVKVQRPGIDKQVYQDLNVLAWLAPFLVGRIPVTALANPPALVELFAATIVEELDFRLEAANMLDVAKVFADLGQQGFVVPRPHPTLVTARVLVMEKLSGFKFDDVDGMVAAGIDTHDIIRTGMLGFLEEHSFTASSTVICTAGTCSFCPTVGRVWSTSASPAASTRPNDSRSSG